MREVISIVFISIQILFANVDNYLVKIESNIADQKYNQAFTLFEQALDEYDASAKLYFIGAQISVKLDKLDLANKYYLESIKLDPKNKEFREEQQKLLELKNDITKAKKTFDSGLINDAISEYKILISKYIYVFRNFMVSSI